MFASLLGWFSRPHNSQARRRRNRHRIRPGFETLEDRAVPAAGLPFSELVVFGDSLSDVGNISDLLGGTVPPASQGYFEGRFSNGPNWAEVLGEAIGVPTLDPSRQGGNDYAFGAATSASSFPNTGWQVQEYLDDNGGAADPNALYSLWVGAVDFLTPGFDPYATLGNVTSQISTLALAGADYFIIPNLPPIGSTPRVQYDDVLKNFADEINAGVGLYNAGLDMALDQLQGFYGITIYRLDVESLFYDVTDHPEKFDLTNAETPACPECGIGGLFDFPNPGLDPADPETSLYWDFLHPTAMGHQILGTQAAANILSTCDVDNLYVTKADASLNPLDGQRSLREVLNLANYLPGEQTIRFDLPGFSSNIKLDRQLTIRDDVIINGPLFKHVTISGGGQTRLFEIEPDVKATLSRLTLRDGSADQGGAILNHGELTLWGIDLVHNKATGNGGALFNDGTASIYLSNFAFNHAGGNGGAVANQVNADSEGGKLLISTSTIAANKADGNGGGVYNGAGATLNLRLSLVSLNRAGGKGGGLFLDPAGTAKSFFNVILLNRAEKGGHNVYGSF